MEGNRVISVSGAGRQVVTTSRRMVVDERVANMTKPRTVGGQGSVELDVGDADDLLS